MIKHNKANTKLYDVWQHIKQRCYNKSITITKGLGLEE